MLASIIQVLSTFVGTESATDGAGETGQGEFGRGITQVGKAQHRGAETLAAEANAVGQVGSVNADIEATLALPCAGCAGFDASPELLAIHGQLV
jgi:hypothetical protein